MTDQRFEVLLFDLGGVLVHFDGITPLLALRGNALTSEDARQFWLVSPSVRRFGRGRCSPDEFAAGAVAELGLPISRDAFLQKFLLWDSGPMEGALELLDSLQSQFRLACLSNNNELHWTRLCNETPLPGRFHHCYVSHEIGLVKPDRDVFDYVVRDLGVEPGRILFLDDNPECVEAAQALGLAAHRARGIEEVRAVLESCGVEVDAAG